MTTYSAFFSSGLLAPQHAYLNPSAAFPRTPPKHRDAALGDSYFAPTPSPARPSSPMAIPDDSDIELDMDMNTRDRDATPTQRGIISALMSTNVTLPTLSKPKSQPRLRKRRSSITMAASPMNAIRSPARTAGAALQLQRHLPPAGAAARSRSGSLVQPGELVGNVARNVASEATSLIGRIRSGSVGGILRPRRGVRKLNGPIPAAVPPPTAPLPALPAFSQAGQRTAFSPALQAQVPPVGPVMTKTRARGFSIAQSETIDEEMKEN